MNIIRTLLIIRRIKSPANKKKSVGIETYLNSNYESYSQITMPVIKNPLQIKKSSSLSSVDVF